MYPDLFRSDSFALHSFGLMMVIGLLVAMAVAKRLARARGLDGEAFINAGIIALLTGIAGARLSHVLENFGDFHHNGKSAIENVKAAINITSGGLTYYGGFLLATPVLILYALRKGIPLRIGMDIIAPCLMIGLAFGRIGCFLNGCCYGAQCDLPWAVRFPYQSFAYYEQVHAGQVIPPDELYEGRYLYPADVAFKNPILRPYAEASRALPVHPAQLYSSATAFLLAALGIAYTTLPHKPGKVFALTLILEGAARFALESVRAEPPVWMHLSLSQILGPLIMGSGLLLWAIFDVLARRPSRTAEADLAAA